MGLELIIKAKEKAREEQYFQMWVAQLPMMAIGGKTIGFNDYLDKLTGRNVDTRPTRELLAELDDIEKKFEVIKNGNGDI